VLPRPRKWPSAGLMFQACHPVSVAGHGPWQQFWLQSRTCAHTGGMMIPVLLW
jgi:hypothetical protein